MRMVSIAGAGVSDMVSLAAAGFILHHGWAKGSAGAQAIRHFLRMRVSQGRQHPRGRRIRGARASIAAAPEARCQAPSRCHGGEAQIVGQEADEHDDVHCTHTPPSGGAARGARRSRAAPRASGHATPRGVMKR